MFKSEKICSLRCLPDKSLRGGGVRLCSVLQGVKLDLWFVLAARSVMYGVGRGVLFVLC